MSADEADLLDMVYPYALDAVAELERRAIENRVSRADETTAAEFTLAVRDIRETLAAMTVVDSLAPPAAVERALMRAVDDLRPAPPRPGVLTRHRRLVAAAAAAVVLMVGGGIAVVANRWSEPQTGVTAQSVLEQPDVRTRTVPVATGGTLVVHTSARLSAASVSFTDVAEPAPGRAYQLWLVPTGGTARSAGVLDRVGTGAPTVVTHYDAVDTLAMTIEPEGGSPQPTGTPIAAVGLA